LSTKFLLYSTAGPPVNCYFYIHTLIAMKIFLLIGCFLILQLAYSQNIVVYAKESPPGHAARKITRAQMEEDTRFWHKVMEESHVNLYHSISKDSLQKLESALLSQIADSITHQQALLLVGQLAGALNEGHIGLPSSSVTDSLYINSSRFPYSLEKIEDSAWVVALDLSQHQTLGAHGRITEVNGITVSALNDRFNKYFGGLNTWKKQQLRLNFRRLLFLHGIQGPFSVKAITADGRNIYFVADGNSKQRSDSINNNPPPAYALKDPYEFRVLADNIAYINYRKMEDLRANPFRSFLNASFSSIRESGATGLIIDLRENSGGHSMYGEWMISYFSTTPYRFGAGSKWKISQHYKVYLNSGQKAFGLRDIRSYESMKDGEIASFTSAAHKPAKNDLAFVGKVAVLIGPETFSSANMMADGIKSYRLATLFGEPTGEAANDFGEMFSFMLPNTGIVARASTKMFTRADGDEKNPGPVMPDISVSPTQQDIKQKKDAVLEAALNWIKRN
jgi:C-terminal processing protease CtpA/Prc